MLLHVRTQTGIVFVPPNKIFSSSASTRTYLGTFHTLVSTSVYIVSLYVANPAYSAGEAQSDYGMEQCTASAATDEGNISYT